VISRMMLRCLSVSVYLLVPLVLTSFVVGHPLCQDFTAPAIANPSLQWCDEPEYRFNESCCTVESENVLRVAHEAAALTIVNPECQSYLKQILCSSCDQYSAHLFGTETFEDRKVPMLCEAYCSMVYEACKNESIVSLRSLVGSNYTGNGTTLAEAYPTGNDFCGVAAADVSSYCYSGMSVVDAFATAPVDNSTQTNAEDNLAICVEQLIGQQPSDVPSPLKIVAYPGNANKFLVVHQTVSSVLHNMGTRLAEQHSNEFGPSEHPASVMKGSNRTCAYFIVYVHYSCNPLIHADCQRTCADGCEFPSGCDDEPLLPSRPCQMDHVGLIQSLVVSPMSYAVLSITNVLRVQQPYGNHNGGEILFGPEDGYLYIFLGDGGAGNDPKQYSQDMTKLLGKALRVDVSEPWPGAPYRVPLDNPFVNVRGARPEIWANGLRNPWRCDFDPRRPTYLLCGDVGQNRAEEVSLIQKGGNYGWPRYEGDFLHQPDAVVDGATPIPPVLAYAHTLNPTPQHSITGGVFVPNTTAAVVFPNDQVDYFFGDLYGIMFAAKETPYSSGIFSNSTVKTVQCTDTGPTTNSRPCTVAENSLGSVIFSFGVDGSDNVLILTQSTIFALVSPDHCATR
ncbi:hypothetical protein SARC_05473, partial [Sphaeroforma arctica JP610]